MVLDSFIKRSVTGGLGSGQAEIMADTAVALASANVALVARKVIGRLCRVGFFFIWFEKSIERISMHVFLCFMYILIQGQNHLILLMYLIDWVKGVGQFSYNAALISCSSIQQV